LFDALRNTPFHPQWFAFFRENTFLKKCCSDLSGVVLDIGCADGKPRQFLPGRVTYIGADYMPTAMQWYGTQPDLFADAQQLPLADNTVDHVLLLDVLEHLPDPGRSLSEIYRVLVAGGTLTMQVPFLYPIHDAPLDFHRWTLHGLIRAAERHGFEVIFEQPVGHPLETAALNTNIAMSKTVLNWIATRNPLALLGLLLPVAVLSANCLAWLLAALSRHDDMMPYAYRMTWRKA
jgi:SAM-dependent methyltransferase